MNEIIPAVIPEVIRFAPALGDWIRTQLAGGEPPDTLVDVMTERAIAPAAARAIVDAFVRSRLLGSPQPIDRVMLREPIREDAYRADAPLLQPGPVIATHDRKVDVLMRASRPTMAVLGNVLAPGECTELIELARGRLRPSTLVDPATGRDITSHARASHGMFFRPAENALVARIDRRLAEIMNMPLSHGEGLQVLHYPAGAGSAPHFDFLTPANDANRASIARSGQRISTLVTYLNDVPTGGETIFPETGWAITPRRGNAVYFEYANRAGAVDHASLHASAATVDAEKWVATKWVRVRPFVSASEDHARRMHFAQSEAFEDQD
jgi:prolyl 4-hydroxylase